MEAGGYGDVLMKLIHTQQFVLAGQVIRSLCFGGCWSYDKKGSCHIWRAETIAEEKAANN
jgi:hypothetical protein